MEENLITRAIEEVASKRLNAFLAFVLLTNRIRLGVTH